MTETAGTVNAAFTATLSAASGKLVWHAHVRTRKPDGNNKVLIVGDNLSEIAETFTLQLSSPQNATIADSLAAGTIADDDGQP